MELIGAAPPNPAPLMIGASPRSPHWPQARDHHLKIQGFCVVCGATKLLNVHHKKPYHLFPELELEESNFITLCETPTHNCHFIVGHSLNWSDYNPKVEELAKFLHDCIKGRLSQRETHGELATGLPERDDPKHLDGWITGLERGFGG